MPPAPKRAAGVPFVLVTVLLDVLTFGLAIPVLPELVKQFQGGDSAAAAAWMGILVAGFSLMQFIFAPVLGALSDRFGRRPILLASIAGAGADQLLLAFAPGIGWLLAGRLLAGLTAANITAAYAYIADVSGPQDRARNFGLVGAAFGVGFVVGPALGGWLGEMDVRYPFLLAAGLAGLNFLYGLFVLPESLAPEHRRPFRWSRANPVAAFGVLRANRTVFGLVSAQACAVLAFGVLQTVWVLYTGQRYGWSAEENGLSLTIVGLATALVQGALIGPLVTRLGDRGAILAGFAAMACGYLLYGLGPSSLVFCTGILLHALGGIAGPTLQGVVSRSVGPDRQGAVAGAMAGMQSFVFIPAPLLGSALFSTFTAPGAAVPFPGMPFLFGTLSLLLGLFLAWRTLGGDRACAAAGQG